MTTGKNDDIILNINCLRYNGQSIFNVCGEIKRGKKNIADIELSVLFRDKSILNKFQEIIKMENFESNETSLDSNDSADSNNGKLRELNESVTAATNCLISFFKSSGEVYTCTKVKICKLLSIASFLFAYQGYKLFNDQILCLSCGTTIKGVTSNQFIFDDIYPVFVNQDKDEKIDRGDDEWIKANKGKHVLLPQVYDVLIDVFFEFGAYPAKNIGVMLDDFKNECVLENKQEIALEKISHIELENNRIFNFIRDYKRINI